jgi:NitT/TauT family transport system ATP-binding protein
MTVPARSPSTAAPQATTSVIEFRGVSHRFVSSQSDPVQALESISMAIERHEFVALVGPSGCGKSTLLRLIAGLIRPTMGSVEIHGQPVVEPRDEIGIVFQRPTLLPWLNVLDNVIFPIRHKHGTVDAASRQRARELLQLVHLADFADKTPDELSGGMQQRVAIARSLLHDPEILLMDEPFSALDALTRDAMSFELLRICRQRPKTVAFVTHSIPEALLLADRIIVMGPRPGRIREIVHVPLSRPRTLQSMSDPAFNETASHIRQTIFGDMVVA